MAGITAVVLYIVGFGLYLAAGSPPDFTDAPKFTAYVHEHATLIIAAALVFGLDFTMLLVWFVGIRDLIRSAAGAWVSIWRPRNARLRGVPSSGIRLASAS